MTLTPRVEPLTEPYRYQLTYTVLADSRLQAIFKADALLRHGVRVVELIEAEQGLPGWWDVVLAVEEDRTEPAEPKWLHEDQDFAPDPIDLAKHEAELREAHGG